MAAVTALVLLAHPRWNDGAEAAGRAARGHDQEMIRRFERRVDALAAVAHHRTLADVGPFGAADTRARRGTRRCPASSSRRPGCARAAAWGSRWRSCRHRSSSGAGCARISAANVSRISLRVGGPLVHDLARRHGRHHGYGRDALRDSAHDRQRLPGRCPPHPRPGSRKTCPDGRASCGRCPRGARRAD